MGNKKRSKKESKTNEGDLCRIVRKNDGGIDFFIKIWYNYFAST